MTRCSHTDQIEITELPEEVGGLRGVPRGRRRLAAPAHLPDAAGTSAAATTHPPSTPALTRGATEHPIIRSLEPGEEWCWCFEDEVGMLIPQIKGRTKIPPSPMLSR